MKTKTVKRKARLSIKSPEAVKQPPNLTFPILLFGLVIVLIGIGIMTAITSYMSNNRTNLTSIEQNQPKDIDWFYNRSIKLASLKASIDNTTTRITDYRNKHGTDLNGYTPNEKTQLETMSAALTLMKSDYNSLAAEYNSYRDMINRSWNKSLPREIYDIP